MTGVTEYLWQSAALLLGAYFLGALIGCLLRRALTSAPRAAEASASQPKPALAPEVQVAAAPPVAPAAAPPAPQPAPVATTPAASAGTLAPAATAAAAAAAATPVAAAVKRLSPADEPGLPSATGSSGHAVVAADVIREPAPAQVATKAAAEPASSVGSIAEAGADDLTLVQAIDEATAKALMSVGITTFKALASLSSSDVERVNAAVGGGQRVQRENWIEQAQMLASGASTDYARRKSAGLSSPVVAAPAAPATAPSAGGTGMSGAQDDLTRIDGINDHVAEKLRGQGITRFIQIARWTADDVARFDWFFGTSGRIAREDWVGQARRFAGIDTGASSSVTLLAAAPTAVSDAIASNVTRLVPERAPAAPPVAPARRDIAGLRSVRSEAIVGAVGPGGDDLKRIRGVGVLIEKKLRSMGYTTYDQVADWTQDEINRVSQALDFRGRIERENWVGQARVLAAGGQTEFSRRFDRGEG